MKTITDRTEFCNQNTICVYCELVGGYVMTDIDEFENNKVEFSQMNDLEFSEWGGKRGYLNYLEQQLKNQDRYFKKNPRKINMNNKRYRAFCDDMILYEIMRSVVTGVFTSVLPIDQHKDISDMVAMNSRILSNTVH